MTLEQYSYETGNIIFPGIEMPARLPAGKYFRNYGIVPDLRKQTISIAQELEIVVDDYHLRKDRYAHMAGLHVGFSKNGDRGAAIFLREGLENDIIDFNYGHESVHAMIDLGIQDQFVEFIRKQGFTLDPFKTFNDEEQIAHVGGLLSWKKTCVIWFYSHPDIDSVKRALMDSRR